MELEQYSEFESSTTQKSFLFFHILKVSCVMLLPNQYVNKKVSVIVSEKSSSQKTSSLLCINHWIFKTKNWAGKNQTVADNSQTESDWFSSIW